MLTKGWFVTLVTLSACSAPPSYVYKGEERAPLTEMEASYKPKRGYVGTPESAAKIAEVVGKEFYGDEKIEKQKPLSVTKWSEIWIVRGNFSSKPDIKGGLIEIRISSDNGEILGMIHGE